MPTIAIINLNDCQFDLTKYAQPLIYCKLSDIDRKNLKNELHNYIWSVIKDHIEFIETNTDCYVGDSVTKIIEEFNRDPNDFLYHSQTSYSNPKKTLELIFCQPRWESYELNLAKNMNKLACLFSLQHTVIENKCAVIGYEYHENNLILGNVTKNDIIGVVKRRYFHSGVYIENDIMTKFYYQNLKYAAIGLFGLDKSDNIEETNFDLFNYNLKILSIPNRTDINKIATRLHGKKQIFGPVILFNMWEENIFANLSLREANRLNMLSNGLLLNRVINESDIKRKDIIKIVDQVEKTESVPVIWNKFIIVEKYIKNYNENLKNKCSKCNKNIINIIDESLSCQKCFRMKYCSESCKNIDNHSNSSDCVQN